MDMLMSVFIEKTNKQKNAITSLAQAMEKFGHHHAIYSVQIKTVVQQNLIKKYIYLLYIFLCP